MTFAPDWTRLAPHRPLGPQEPGYVDRPDHGNVRIAEWLLAGRSPLLLAGPVGVGKSTELAHAAALLQPQRVAVLVPLDRLENMRLITQEQALLRIAGRLVDLAVRVLHLPVSDELRAVLFARAVLPEEARGKQSSWPDWSASATAHAALKEVASLSTQHRVVLLVDGLEKSPDPALHQVLDALIELRKEADLVVVVPWSAAYGPGADTVLAEGERLVVIRPVNIDDPSGPGRRFLFQLAATRLALPAPIDAAFRDVLDECAIWSGGVPRGFLQLLADAASYARLLRNEPWPTRVDVERAVADQRESFRRLLLPGDDKALVSAEGTDGREVELGTKLRLLSHGMLAEHEDGGLAVLRAHPIVRQLLTSPGITVAFL